MQSEVMAQLAEKKRQAEARLAELKRQLEEGEAELTAMAQSEANTSEALTVFERLLDETPNELKPGLFKILFKTLEQEAKRNGINLQAEVSVSATASSNGKRTRSATVDLEVPERFEVFPTNNRLAVDGFIDGDSVKYSKVYIGVDGLRQTPACDGSASAWKGWLTENLTCSIKTGTIFNKASLAGIEGNYLLELNGVSIKDLSKLVDIDFAQSPTSEENEQRMNRDYAQLSLSDAITKGEPDPEAEPQPEQTEEIMESEPVKVEPVAAPVTPPEDLHPVGAKFQLKGISGFDGNYGEVVAWKPKEIKPYECKVDGFPHNLMLSHAQIEVIPNDETVDHPTKTLEEIPF